MKEFSIYCDGGSRGNPGPSAGGFVVFSNGEVIYEHYMYLGTGTNNFAEYSSVIGALKWLIEKSKTKEIKKVEIHLDSQLVVNQLMGKYKIKSKNLIPLAGFCKKLQGLFPGKISYVFVPRSENKYADSLVNKALDENMP